MSQYAQIADLVLYGTSANALAQFTAAQQNAALATASAYADTKLAGRYPLPLLTWDASITRHVCYLAAFDLISTRGFDPGGGADTIFMLRNNMAIKFFDDVERQNTHPTVTFNAPASPSYNAPQVYSSSMTQVGGNGPTASQFGKNRGW